MMLLPVTASLVEVYVDSLPAKLAAAKDEAALVAIEKAAPKDVKVSETRNSDGRLIVTLQFAPIKATTLVHEWKLDTRRPYAYALDVHQVSWTFGVWKQDVPDQYNDRIYVVPLTYGKWTLDPRLDGRPKGALPKKVTGASPAYDLALYPASVVAIEIEATAP